MRRKPQSTAVHVRLRGMTAGDGPSMARLHRDAILAVPDALASREDRESWAHGIGAEDYASNEAEGREAFLLAELDGAIVGFASYAQDGTVGEITRLYVAVEWQGCGIGRRLAERAEAILRGHGATRLRVHASLSGVSTCEAFGFERVGGAPRRTQGGRDLPTVAMEKSLSGDWRNFYGRRHGKKLRDSQKVALARLAALLPGPVSRDENPRRDPLDLSPFGGRRLWLEIGFGGGEHLIHQARHNPDVQLLGAEPFVNGVAMLLAGMDAAGVANVSVHQGDARDLVEVLPDASISRAFLLYPDPWPKRRHHRRRFVTAGHLAPLARVLVPGAEFRVATDVPDYVRQARAEVPRHGFVETTVDDALPWPDWTRTRYEAKALRERRRPHYLTFLRR